MKLHAANIIKHYGNRTVVKGVSFDVKQGEIVGLLGPNGAGKTTSFYMIVGLIKPNEGKVFLDEVEITDEPMYRRAKLGVGYLPQEASVFRKLSVESNIKAVLELTSLTRAEQSQKLETLLDEFGLTAKRKYIGNQLSGGERRRTEIARTLATNPKFILLDEPFAGVDPIAVEDIQRIVSKLKLKNIGILITDHNVQETLSITDRAYLLYDGSILKSGTAEELAADEQVRRLYLGQNFVLQKDGVVKILIAILSSTQILLVLLAGCSNPVIEEKPVPEGYSIKNFPLVSLDNDSVFANIKLLVPDALDTFQTWIDFSDVRDADIRMYRFANSKGCLIMETGTFIESLDDVCSDSLYRMTISHGHFFETYSLSAGEIMEASVKHSIDQKNWMHLKYDLISKGTKEIDDREFGIARSIRSDFFTDSIKSVFAVTIILGQPLSLSFECNLPDCSGFDSTVNQILESIVITDFPSK